MMRVMMLREKYLVLYWAFNTCIPALVYIYPSCIHVPYPHPNFIANPREFRRFREGGLSPFGWGLSPRRRGRFWSGLESSKLSQLARRWWTPNGLRWRTKEGVSQEIAQLWFLGKYQKKVSLGWYQGAVGSDMLIHSFERERGWETLIFLIVEITLLDRLCSNCLPR